MLRSVSSHSYRERIKPPKHFKQVEKRTMTILTKNRSANKFKQATEYQKGYKQFTEKTPFRETGTTLGQGFSHRIKSSNVFFQNNLNPTQYRQQRPRTQQKSSKKKIPLKLFNRQNQLSPLSIHEETATEKQQVEKKKYLRKGTSINRAIMINIMKSKCNGIIVDSANSYTNYAPNQPLALAVKHQLPRGMRDTIGCEQTLRMSNIFTGGNIKSVNFHNKAHMMIKNHLFRPQSHQEEEQITLKSIKRW